MTVQRFRGGVVQFVAYPTAGDGGTDPTHAINVGDLVGVSGGVAYPASHFATAAAFYSAFAGVAVQKIGLNSGEHTFLLTTDPGWILVATSGDFAFDCASGISWRPNSGVIPYVTGGACANQQVALANGLTNAIGIVHLPYSDLGVTTLTEVVVSIKPAYRFDQAGSGQ